MGVVAFWLAVVLFAVAWFTAVDAGQLPWLGCLVGLHLHFMDAGAWLRRCASDSFPAVHLQIAMMMDQNLTSVMVNNLRKGPGYYLDFFVLGAMTLTS